MEKIGVFFAQGFEEIEALTVVDIVRRAGMQASMISVTDEKEVTGSHGISVKVDELLSETDFKELSMLVLPGGMPGTMNLEACEPLMEQLDCFYQSGKYISAICAAPSIFGHRGYLKDRNACSYPTKETELTGAYLSDRPVEISGHVITSRGMGTAIDFALAIVERFLGKEEAVKLAQQIVYKG